MRLRQRRRGARHASGAAVALLALTVSGPARADLHEMAGRVAADWRAAGAETTLLPTRFLFDEESVVVPIPPEPAGPEGDDGAPRCTRIAVLGARGLSFRARLSDAPVDPLLPPEPMARASSSAGVLELQRCQVARGAVRHVILTAEAGRGALEVVLARSRSELTPLGTIIPERTGGTIPPPPEAGSLPPLIGQDKRVEAAESRSRREGATVRPRGATRAADDGSGEEEVDLDEGCHRIEVFGRDFTHRPGRRFRLDVDAELRDGEHILARDRTEAPDARVDACVGAPTRVTVGFAGAPPGSEVVITRGTWPLPARLPPIWGPETRSKMARVMFLRHVAVPPDDPVVLVQGSTGAEPTPLPLSLETGGCYVAVVGVTRGRARQLQVRAIVGSRESTDERGAVEEAALSAFCVRAHERARVEVLAKGTGVSWGLAVFRVRSGVWEPGR